MSKKRIVFLDDGKAFGGAEKNLLLFLDHLDRQLLEATIVTSYQGKFFDLAKRKQIPIHTIISADFVSTSFNKERFDFLNPFALIYNFFLLIVKGFKLGKFLKKQRIDIIQTNGMFEHIYGGLGAKLAGVYCIWFMQDIPRGSFRCIKRSIINLLASMLASKVVAVSEATRKAFYPWLRKNTACIRVGIDIGKYLGSQVKDITETKEKWGCADSEFIVGMAGRLIYWKGAKDFIRAAVIVSLKKHARFVIIGDADPGDKLYIEKLKSLARELNIEDKVIFTGFLEDVTAGVNILDIFAHCPFYPDPCPIAVMEAAALGKAIVATRVGGIPEIIEDGKEGLLANPSDSKDLAQKII
ncbi:MAG: glycosyltransferase, partial [Candidatus Omnitrophica bacterium]|nr:glycosyltransferase [Candidatus Omnitrophota bacterium]